MRSQLATLKNPEMILRIAREENKLEDVERICIFKSTETFDQLRKNKLVKEDALLFINSIASVSLNDEDRERFHRYFSHIPVSYTHLTLTDFTSTHDTSNFIM